MANLWVVVADEAIARILHWPPGGQELESVEELADPDAHARDADLRRDAYGRRAGSATHGARQDTAHRLRGSATVTSSAGEAETHQEAEAFAKRVAAHLAQARQQGRFDELHLVAAPRFLGLLRKALPEQVERAVRQSLDKDLVHLDNRQLTQHVFPQGRPAQGLTG